MNRRTGSCTFFVVAVFCAACSTGSTTITGAEGGTEGGVDGGGATDGSTTSDGALPGARPRAIVRMNGGAAAGCATVPAYTVGDFGDATMGVPPSPIDDGTAYQSRLVAITCKVAANASGGFDLAASIATAGDATLTLSGAIDAQGKSKAGVMTLKKAGVSWSSSTCSLDATFRPEAGVAAGRYWTSLACGGSKSDTGATCDIFGEIRIENCAQ